MQAQGQPARLVILEIGSTVDSLLGALEERKVEFKLQSGNYAAFSRAISSDCLRASCSQDGRTEATALEFRCDQVPFSPLSAARQTLGHVTKHRGEATIVKESVCRVKLHR